jgi:hypothetical protein
LILVSGTLFWAPQKRRFFISFLSWLSPNQSIFLRGDFSKVSSRNKQQHLLKSFSTVLVKEVYGAHLLNLGIFCDFLNCWQERSCDSHTVQYVSKSHFQQSYRRQLIDSL